MTVDEVKLFGDKKEKEMLCNDDKITNKITLNVSETAAALGLSRPTVYKLCKREDFPALRVGNRTLISKAGLVRWVEQQAEVVG